MDYNQLFILSNGNPVTFTCDGTRPQKCYQIKLRKISSEYNSTHVNDNDIEVLIKDRAEPLIEDGSLPHREAQT